jgi:hypothetical protein
MEKVEVIIELGAIDTLQLEGTQPKNSWYSFTSVNAL